MNKVRYYINLLTSLAHHKRPVGSQSGSSFIPTFKIQGKLSPCIVSLLQTVNKKSVYVQLYFLVSENEMGSRLLLRGADNDLDENIQLGLQKELHMHNSYPTGFKHLFVFLRNTRHQENVLPVI